MPKNAIFVVKNSQTGQFYPYGFKRKEDGAKAKRNELNAEHVKDLGLQGVSPKNGPWIVSKGPKHPNFAG